MYKAPVDVMRYLCPGRHANNKRVRRAWGSARGSRVSARRAGPAETRPRLRTFGPGTFVHGGSSQRESRGPGTRTRFTWWTKNHREKSWEGRRRRRCRRRQRRSSCTGLRKGCYHSSRRRICQLKNEAVTPTVHGSRTGSGIPGFPISPPVPEVSGPCGSLAKVDQLLGGGGGPHGPLEPLRNPQLSRVRHQVGERHSARSRGEVRSNGEK